MAEHNDFGKQGEEYARRYLVEHGYEILETNWRIGRLEADIIAQTEGYVVFVEVKTRSREDYGAPEIFVDRKKQRSYVKLANAYMLKNHRDEEARFDIITVVINKTGFKLNHMPRAYTTIG